MPVTASLWEARRSAHTSGVKTAKLLEELEALRAGLAALRQNPGEAEHRAAAMEAAIQRLRASLLERPPAAGEPLEEAANRGER
jgi:hypothetical protein